MLKFGFSLPPAFHASKTLETQFPLSGPSSPKWWRTRKRGSRLGFTGPTAVLSVERKAEGDETKGRGKGEEYDAIVIGSGIGGLVAGTQLAVKGARVLVLEKYLIPGGSSGFYERDGFTFDVGSSVMFGFSDKVLFFS